MNGEQLHKWYLEATRELKPESFNPNAQKPYSELTDEQKFIDKYIADKIKEWVKEKINRQEIEDLIHSTMIIKTGNIEFEMDKIHYITKAIVKYLEGKI